MISDHIEQKRQAFIYGFHKGIRDDDQDLNTTCPCCDKPMSFGDLPDVVVNGIGDLLDVYLGASPGALVNILADYMSEAMNKINDVHKAATAGYIIGEEAMDRAKIFDLYDLREDG